MLIMLIKNFTSIIFLFYPQTDIIISYSIVLFYLSTAYGLSVAEYVIVPE